MSAASPGVVSLFFHNDYYKTQEEYLHAIADAMQHEYETIANAGIVLQLDCPDLGMGRHVQYAGLSLGEFIFSLHSPICSLIWLSWSLIWLRFDHRKTPAAMRSFGIPSSRLPTFEGRKSQA